MNFLDCTITKPSFSTINPDKTSIHHGESIVFSCESTHVDKDGTTSSRSCQNGDLTPSLTTEPFVCNESLLLYVYMYNNFFLLKILFLMLCIVFIKSLNVGTDKWEELSNDHDKWRFSVYRSIKESEKKFLKGPN